SFRFLVRTTPAILASPVRSRPIGFPAKGVLMWIVRLALRRPYTFVVMSLLLFLLGPVVVARTPVDIFPNINIPVVSVVWNYSGLSPQQLSDRIVTTFERN